MLREIETEWWFRYRDYDKDGFCEYNHGNDSGWDNSTAFSPLPPVATPELQAFLTVQMEEEDCLEQLHNEVITYDKEESEHRYELALNMIGDIMPVKLIGSQWNFIELWDTVAQFHGLIIMLRLSRLVRNTLLRQRLIRRLLRCRIWMKMW